MISKNASTPPGLPFRSRCLLVAAGLTLLLGVLSSPPARAEEQILETAIGSLTAFGDLVMPDEPAPDAPLVLLLHGTLAHKDMELLVIHVNPSF